MDFLLWFVLGMWAGGIANAIWYWKWSIYDARRGRKLAGKYASPILVFFEHYHWATILYILGFRLNIPFLVGFATMLLIDESVGQNHKFSLGSGHEIPSLAIEVFIVALWILAELLVKAF
jgi:hypothetical protein